MSKSSATKYKLEGSLNMKVLLIIIFVLVVGFLAGRYFQIIPNTVENYGQVNESEKIDSSNAKVYKLNIKNLSNTGMDATDIENAISELIPSETNSVKIYHDGTFDISSNSNTFYLVTTSNINGLKRTSQNRHEVMVISEEDKVKPYLEDARYCKADSDCTDNAKYCQIGAYNQYSQYSLYGCGYITGVEGYSSEELDEATKNCPDQGGYPGFNATFSGAKCINNTCTAQNMKITCGD